MTPGGTGGISATIDEIAISQDAPYAYSIFLVNPSIDASIDASATAIPIVGILQLSKSGGLIKIDDEIFGVCGVEVDLFTPV